MDATLAILGVFGIGILAVGCLAIGLFRQLFPRARYCPGPPAPWWWHVAWVPGWFLMTNRCRYDLRTLRADPGTGQFRCPECGMAVGVQTRTLASTRPLRIGRVGFVVLFAMVVPLASCFLSRPATTRRFLEDPNRDNLGRMAPTWALLLADRFVPEHMTYFQGREVGHRLGADATYNWPTRVLALHRLKTDLRDDSERWNAGSAIRMINRHYPDDAFEIYRSLLWSDDAQQREIAANELYMVFRSDPPAWLMSAALDLLRESSAGSFHFLRKHARAARPYLRKGMRSGERVLPLYCALIVGFTRQVDLIHEAAPILISHLGHNRLSEDAMWASRALVELGPGVLPWLESFRETSDEQQRTTIAYLIWHLTPEADRRDVKAPERPRISNSRDFLALAVERLPMRRFR